MILLFVLLFQLTPPANAIFGLSVCEKVKKQVLDYERKINAAPKKYSTYVANLPGTFEKPSVPLKFEKEFIDYRKFNWVGELVKITYNNPKCFTRTQKVEINLRKKANWDSSDFLTWNKRPIGKKAKACRPDDVFFTYSLSEGDGCFLGWKLEIIAVSSIPSIYGY
jgi:hypothetical protein